MRIKTVTVEMPKAEYKTFHPKEDEFVNVQITDRGHLVIDITAHRPYTEEERDKHANRKHSFLALGPLPESKILLVKKQVWVAGEWTGYQVEYDDR